MVWLVAGLFVLVGIAVLNNARLPTGAAPETDLGDLGAIKPAIDQIPMRAAWERIEINQANRQGYSLKLWYRENAYVTVGEPSADTTFIARVVLGALVRAGRSPTTEHVSLFVWAQRRTHGETGAPLVVLYGDTAYNYNDDGLRYDACSGKITLFGC